MAAASAAGVVASAITIPYAPVPVAEGTADGRRAPGSRAAILAVKFLKHQTFLEQAVSLPY
ncbi:hypothetical protein MY1884_009648 [Beauveria asiatica]